MTWRFDNSFRINSYKDRRLLLTKSIDLVDDVLNHLTVVLNLLTVRPYTQVEYKEMRSNLLDIVNTSCSLSGVQVSL